MKTCQNLAAGGTVTQLDNRCAIFSLTKTNVCYNSGSQEAGLVKYTAI